MRKSRVFKASDLRKVSGAYPWPAPPHIGTHVTLNSGGPDMMVVEIDGDEAVTAQASGLEHRLPWVCLRPITPGG